MSDVLTSKECCKHEEQALAWETVFGQLRKGNEKFYLGDGTGEQLAVREIERLQQRVDAARKILEPLHECDPDIREWLGMPRWDEGVIETRAAEPPTASRGWSQEDQAAVLDASIMWTYCPRFGSYKEGPAVEDTCEALTAAVERMTGKTLGDELWSLREMRAAIIDAGLAATKDESLPEIEQLGTVTMKCKPATKLEPLPPVETGEGQ